MSAALAGGVLLREVPARLIAGIQSGELEVYGSIVKSFATGRIAGHLQETAGLAKLASDAVLGLGAAPLSATNIGVDIVGHTASFIQNEQIKAAIASVQNLQLANLAVSGLSIGVSLAGTVALSAKIGRVEAKVDALLPQLERLVRVVQSLRQDRIAEDFTMLRTLATQMDEGWRLSSPETQWRTVATTAHALADSFERRALELLAEDAADPMNADPFLDALSVASAIRISARLAAGDDAVARTAAVEVAESLIILGRKLQVSDVVLARMKEAKTEAASTVWGDKLDELAGEATTAIGNTREREAGAISCALTVIELERQEISGRDWLQAARDESKQPLLFLEHKG